MLPDAGYFDLQVNGYAGVDFNNDDFTVEQLHQSCQRIRDDGVAGILATIITDDVEVMCRRISRVCQFRKDDALVAEVIRGIHVEGPFLNEQPGFIVAHPPHHARPADLAIARRFVDATCSHDRAR